jgi:hypothetical protein
MKLEDLLRKIPEEKAGIQILSQCLVGIKEKRRPNIHSEVTFVSDAVTPMFALGKSDKVGIVLWIDKDAYNEAIKKQGGAE